MESFSFTCACCGETIKGLPDLGYAAPVYYDALTGEELADRAYLDSDICIIDGENCFIRVVCPVPVIDAEIYFGWGIWVSLSEDNFARYRDSFSDSDQSKLGQMFGWLSNRLPGYPDTLNLPMTVVPQDNNQRPLAWINKNRSDHPLYVHQRDGMGKDALGEIYAQTVCSNAKK